MRIQSVRLRNYRNYEYTEFHPAPGMNLITGMNAQGKTNLLESLVYLSLTRSHRVSDEKKLIREDMPFADIQCVFEDNGRKTELEAVIHPKGKSLLVQKYPVKKSSDFIGLLNVVLFAPDDLAVFHDQPRVRRRMINQEITKISPKYLLHLNRFQNLLKEKNILLKRDHPDIRYLDTLDEQISEAEACIIEYRRDFTETINRNITEIYRKVSGDTDAVIHIEYQCCIQEEECTKENLLSFHQRQREKDFEMHATSAGIQREDIQFEINGVNLIYKASQGQKRMIMLAYKLGLLEYIEKKTGKKPVLLLDDVLSELDSDKQRRLLEIVSSGYQCVITSTDIPPFFQNRGYTEFRIDDGTIRQQGGNL